MVLLNWREVAVVAMVTPAEVRAMASFSFDDATRPAYFRRMTWLMPLLLRVAPYIGYVLVSARKPGTLTMEAP